MSDTPGQAPVTPSLRCEGLRKSFGALLVNNDVSLELHRGEVHALIGPNGAGKTTVLAQLSGELRPDKGRIFVDDQDVTEQSMPERVHAGITRSYQISSVFGSFTARQSVELALQARDRHSFRFIRPASRNHQRIERASELLGLVGLDDLGTSYASELSHGQKRQLEIAMALASEPTTLLLDEPMAGMGPREADTVTMLIADLAQTRAVLLVEHDMDIVFNVASRISVLAEGSCIASGSPASIRQNALVRSLYLHREIDQ